MSTKNQEEIDIILKDIKVENIWGVGRQLSKLYQHNGIKTAYQLKYSNFSWIRKNTNVFGLKTAMELKGIPCINLETQETKRKSCCVSRSFGDDALSFKDLKESVISHCLNAAEKIRQDTQLVKSIVVSISNSPFDKKGFLSRSKKIDLAHATDDSLLLSKECLSALKAIFVKGFIYQKTGVVFLGLLNKNEYKQDLFREDFKEKSNNLMKAIDSMNIKFGRNTLATADSGLEAHSRMKRNYSSKIDTASFDFLTYCKKWLDL